MSLTLGCTNSKDLSRGTKPEMETGISGIPTWWFEKCNNEIKDQTWQTLMLDFLKSTVIDKKNI